MASEPLRYEGGQERGPQGMRRGDPAVSLGWGEGIESPQDGFGPKYWRGVMLRKKRAGESLPGGGPTPTPIFLASFAYPSNRAVFANRFIVILRWMLQTTLAFSA